MTSPRELKGVISWKSVGTRMALGQALVTVADAMIPAVSMSADSSIFDPLPLIAQQHDYVLIRQPDRQIAGIISASDMNEQFKSWTEPFWLLEQIEKHLRHLINTRLLSHEKGETLSQCGKPNVDQRAADLTFGDYCQLINHDARWPRLNLSLDQAAFCAQLDKVRQIRNRVMHFNPDGIDPAERKALRDFAALLALLPMARVACAMTPSATNGRKF